ncbi:MAG TPA: aromatic ring-hydroxylating dioxygenase subunit alpha [Kofleriaceae bacterium]|nr:aromatic ring-hydroxylating dioxygenase subunit alpha [Kofleriaceae bacterium]
MRPRDTRAALEAGHLTLPGRYYTDPAYFAREEETIFRRMWLYVGRDEDVPAGRWIARRLAGASVLVVRGDDGVVRAFHNVCRHRGTLLCWGDQGAAAGHLQCPYHAWTYRLDGALHRAPHMDKVEGFRADDWPLRPVPLARWAGNLFVFVGDEEPPPLAEQLAGLEERFAPWRIGELVRVAARDYQLAANWKLVVANYHECLHCPNAHPQLNRLSHYLGGENHPPQPGWLGATMELAPGVPTLSTSAAPARAPLPGVDEAGRRQVHYYALLPSMLVNVHPDYVVQYRLTALAPDRTDIRCEWLMHPDEANRAGFDPSDAVDFWDLTNRQDWELSDRAQAGIGSTGYRPGPYSHREEMLIAFDRWVVARAGTL